MARQFATPILLPADPTTALHAATKGYTDAAATAARATVSTTAPTSPVTGQEWVPAGASRRNECSNPAAANNLTGWVSSNGPVRMTGLSGAGLVRTTGAQEPGTGLLIAPKDAAGVGETWTVSCYVNPATTMNLAPNVSFYDGTDTYLTEVAGPSVNCPTGSWTRLSHTVTTPASTAKLTVYVSGVTGGVTMTQVLYEHTATLGTYFDGASTDGTWDGAAGNTASTLATQYPPMQVWDGSAWIDCGDPRVGPLSDSVAGKANTSDLTGYAPITRQITAGTGLSGGGDLSADRTVAVSYGSAAGTAAQGNDARLLAGYGHAGLWDQNVYGDLCSNGARDDATGTWAFSATNRTLVLLLGLVPAGTYTGFRLFRTTAITGGTVSANLFTASSRTATSWAQAGSNVTPVLSATGQVDTACALTLAAPTWVALQVVLTGTAPSVYPVLAASPAGQAALINPATGSVVSGASNGTTAPATTLNPTTGFTTQTQKPWASLY